MDNLEFNEKIKKVSDLCGYQFEIGGGGCPVLFIEMQKGLLTFGFANGPLGFSYEVDGVFEFGKDMKDENASIEEMSEFIKSTVSSFKA